MTSNRRPPGAPASTGGQYAPTSRSKIEPDLMAWAARPIDVDRDPDFDQVRDWLSSHGIRCDGYDLAAAALVSCEDLVMLRPVDGWANAGTVVVEGMVEVAIETGGRASVQLWHPHPDDGAYYVFADVTLLNLENDRLEFQAGQTRILADLESISGLSI